jgi:aminoglycoside phosphotransferase (APT) family kinase protein
MRTAPEPVPFDRTATRPAYTDLPHHVRERIEHHLGGRPHTVHLAGGGFTSGFAARLTTDSGTMFVKTAGPQTPVYIDHYETEASVLAALPDEIPAPRLRFFDDDTEWVILGIEAVPARPVSAPITPADLNRMLDAWADAAACLDPAPQTLTALGITADDPTFFQRWTAAASGDTAAVPVPPRLAGRLDELAELEQGLPAAVASAAATHNDLRPDNMIIGARQAWICDWNHVTLRAPWFDTAAFLTAVGPGHDRDALFRNHATTASATAEELDTLLAALSGFFAAESARPIPTGASSYLRAYQAGCALAAAEWLADRRRW